MLAMTTTTLARRHVRLGVVSSLFVALTGCSPPVVPPTAGAASAPVVVSSSAAGAGAAAESAAAPAGVPDFTALVQRVGPAVVNATTSRRGTAAAPLPVQPGDPFFEFFRRFMPPDDGDANIAAMALALDSSSMPKATS